MFRRKVEFDGLQAIGEAFRNSASAFQERVFAGPVKISAIPELITRGKNYFILTFRKYPKK